MKLNNILSAKPVTQQIFVGLEDVFKTSSRLALKTLSTHLQCNNFTSSKKSWRGLENILQKTSWKRLEDDLKTSFKTSWKTKNCQAEDVFKMSWRRVLKTSGRHVLKMTWRYYRDKKNSYWVYLYTYLGITNENAYLTSLYFANLYLTILKRI